MKDVCLMHILLPHYPIKKQKVHVEQRMVSEHRSEFWLPCFLHKKHVPCFSIIILNVRLKDLGVLAFSIMQAKRCEYWKSEGCLC